MGADYLATGHYCQTRGGKLLKGADAAKDQSYFLNAIDGEVLNKVLFPIGGMEKTEVRALARQYDLPTHAKKDSTGICFIGERHFTSFLAGYVAAKPGEFRTLDETVVGTHRGVAYYTPGQRKQLGLGGPGEPWFVVKKNISDNIVYVERGKEHPALYHDELTASELSWIGQAPEIFPLGFRCQAKIRYRQQDQDCTLTQGSVPGTVRVYFDSPQRAIAKRQSIAFYQGNQCLGGGFVEAAGPSYYEMEKNLPKLPTNR